LEESTIFSFFMNHFKLVGPGALKLETSLKRALTANNFIEGTSSLILIKHYFENSDTKVYYMPSTLEHLLLAFEINHEKIIPVAFHSVSRLVTKAIKMGYIRLLFLFKKTGTYIIKIGSSMKAFLTNYSVKEASVSQSFSKMNYDEYEIAFFPHKNITYATFFNKTYLYDNNPDSLFYKEKVLTLFHGQTDPLSERFLKLYRIPHANVYSFYSNQELLRELFKVLKQLKYKKLFLECSSLKNAIGNLFIFHFLMRTIRNVCLMKHFKSLKVVYCHYDILMTNDFLLACYICSIKTVSYQERTEAYTWMFGLIYDHYFIAGKLFQQELIKRGFSVEKYHVVGLPRSTYIKEPNHKFHYQKYLQIKEKYTLVVCYDLPPLNNFLIGVMGQQGTEQQLLNFYNALINLAQEFPKLYFVLKPKDISTFTSTPFKEVESAINHLENFEVIKDLKKHNPYTMAFLADIIIGQPTSILVEAFSVGKRVIYYDDNDHYFRPLNYIINRINIVEYNYEGLKNRIVEIIQEDKYLDTKEWKNFNENYFQSENNEDGFLLIKRFLKEIYNETINKTSSKKVLS
jgi:hypothetical protein